MHRWPLGATGLLSTPRLSWGPALTLAGLLRVMPMKCLEQGVAPMWHRCAKGDEDSTLLVQVLWVRCCLEKRNMDNKGMETWEKKPARLGDSLPASSTLESDPGRAFCGNISLGRGRLHAQQTCYCFLCLSLAGAQLSQVTHLTQGLFREGSRTRCPAGERVARI